MTFQLPALAKGNCFTVVVGPLMALAKDQVLPGQLRTCIKLPPCAPHRPFLQQWLAYTAASTANQPGRLWC